jgi:hypothetical protein
MWKLTDFFAALSIAAFFNIERVLSPFIFFVEPMIDLDAGGFIECVEFLLLPDMTLSTSL